MLKFKDFDLLNENLNRARAVLNQVGIPESNPNFIKLRELLKNNLGYVGKFTEWMFLQKVEFTQLENLYNRIKGERLNKPIDQFKTPEEVIDSLVRSTVETDINQILNSIPGRTRQFLKDCDDYKNLESFFRQNSGKKDLLIDFFSKKGGRYGEYDEDDVIVELIEDLEKIVDAKSISDISKMSKSSKDIKFIFEDDKLLIVAVNYNGIKEVGSNYWCIVEDEDTFNDYVIETDEPTIQLVVYFKDKVPFIDDRSVLGVTWKLADSGYIGAAHWEDDSGWKTLPEFNKNRGEIEKLLKSLKSKLSEVLPTIYDIKETNWAYSSEEFFMPSLMGMIESYKSSGKVEPIEDFFSNWLLWVEETHDFDSVNYKDEIKNLTFYKKVVPLLKSLGIKLNLEWKDIIYLNLSEIAKIDKNHIRSNIFDDVYDCMDSIIKEDKERRNFYLWLIENGYDLESKARHAVDILDLINLKIIDIQKNYKRIDFGDLNELNITKRITFLDWIRDNDEDYLTSKVKPKALKTLHIRTLVYILESLSRKSDKFGKILSELISDKYVFDRIKDTSVIKNIYLTGSDDLKIQIARNIIPKEVFDEFDVILTKKTKKIKK